MTWPNQATCRRCGRRMRTVAEIAPIGRDPGLAAFLCTYCGAADSVLIYPSSEAWEESARQHHGSAPSGRIA